MYKLLDWIDTNKLNWNILSKNPKAIDLLEKNYLKIDWEFLLLNPNSISILEKNTNKINWDILSNTKNFINLLEKNTDKINWNRLSKNKYAINILEKNIDKINWDILSNNKNAINLLEQNITTHAFTNNLSDSTVKISDGRLKFVNTKVQEPLTFRYLEKTLSEIIKNESQVKLMMEHIREKRSVKIVPEIKRFSNN